MIVEYYKDAVFILVTIHEMFGHGTGRMFRKKGDLYNYKHDDVFCPFEGKDISNRHYEVNETFNSKFGDIATAFDECRADCVALYLCTYLEFLDILFVAKREHER